LGKNDLDRHNSVNESGFGRNVSKWVGKEKVLPSNVISYAVVGKNKGHPAVFPVDLPLFFIKLMTPENGLVIDPFGGSGSTGVAALQSGRNCVLIDNNETYCQVAAERIQKETNAELDLLPESQHTPFYDHKNNGAVAQLRLLESGEEVSKE
jgi:site-specific DNA-methyltransferase (adenine-specific)/site-specific DNA-methyltransferase (cytosine-N4-specific)